MLIYSSLFRSPQITGLDETIFGAALHDGNWFFGSWKPFKKPAKIISLVDTGEDICALESLRQKLQLFCGTSLIGRLRLGMDH